MPIIRAVINLTFASYLTDIIYIYLASYSFIKFMIYRRKIHKKTFFFVILLSIVQCFFEYDLYCTPRSFDTFFFFIITTVLTRSIASFFSNDHDLRAKDISKHGKEKLDKHDINIRKLVFLRLHDKKKVSDFLGHERLYLKVDMNDEKASEYVENLQKFFKNDYNQIINFYNQLNEMPNNNAENTTSNDIVEKINTEYNAIVKKILTQKFKQPFTKELIKEKLKKFERKKKESKIPGTKIIAKELIKHARIYANILEMGLFQYFTYSHRVKDTGESNDEEYTKEYTIGSNNEEINENNNEKIEILINRAEVKWIVIPRVINDDEDDKNGLEHKHCKKIQDALNTE
ncbi:10321_t:CDS:1 [Cetraspora pellucida]|uniref:10321_t:CDS:1 n=1 Tax=Cetraspora pellucida TaxID=1433469 RepID=A0ACA9JW81_9GLOM|nr:10321_t:CDS:1 [Cetraspora pellucida]